MNYMNPESFDHKLTTLDPGGSTSKTHWGLIGDRTTQVLLSPGFKICLELCDHN